MKIAVRVLPVLLLIGVLVSGCALFGSRHKGGTKTPGSQATASRQRDLTKSTAGSNQMPAAATGSEPVSTTNNTGTVSSEASTGAGGTGAGPGAGGGSGAGGETAPGGYSAFFYICVLLAAAVVIWVIWAIWRRYRARHGPIRPHHDHRPA